MKRILVILVAFTLLAFASWPYVTLYRLDRAVSENDLKALDHMVDIEVLRRDIVTRIETEVDATVGQDANSLFSWIAEGVKQIGKRAVDVAIDVEWVQTTLAQRGYPADTQPPALLSDVSFAFYSGLNTFRVTVAGQGNSRIELELTLRDSRWRLTALHD